MTRLFRYTALLASLACTPLALAEESVDEIIAHHLEARGGLENLTAIATARKTGAMSMMGGHGHGGGGGGPTAPVLIEYRLSDQSIRLEFEFQGKKGVQAYDGETGWFVQPFLGKNDAEEMAEAQLKKIRQQADFLGALVNYKEKGHNIELLGTEDVEGTEAYKLKLTKADGDVDIYFLDTEYYLPFRRISKTEMQGRKVETATTFGDYKEVGDVLFAHSFAVEFPGGGQTMTYSKIELNVEISGERFAMPEKAAANTAG